MIANTKDNYKWFALSCTTLGALISSIDGSVLVIALPTIARDLRSPLETVMWTMMIYMLSLAILVPSIGRFADIIGRKKLYVSGFALFTISSLFCGLVHTGGQLVLARFIQSVGGSLMMANSSAIVTDAFPKHELGRSLGINGMVISVGATLGPILGGALTAINWRLVFFINVPLGIIGTIWAILQLREIVKLPEGQRMDWLGTSLFTAGMTLLLLALTFGVMDGLASPLFLGGLSGGLLLLACFIYVESRVQQPMLDLSLFRQRLLAAAYSCNFLNGVARGVVTFMMVFFFQVIWGIDPLKAGILMTPFALAQMVVAPISGWLSDRYGSRELAAIGLACAAVGLSGLARLHTDTSLAELIAWMVVMGAGSGFFMSPNNNAIMGAVAPERRGIASGARTMMNNSGTVISLALGVAMIGTSMSTKTLQNLLIGIQVGSQGVAVSQFLDGLHRTFWLSFTISLIAVVAALLRGPRQPVTTGAGHQAPDIGLKEPQAFRIQNSE
jgi:EmrB/QacA subfamily drug resistance transporter